MLSIAGGNTRKYLEFAARVCHLSDLAHLAFTDQKHIGFFLIMFECWPVDDSQQTQTWIDRLSSKILVYQKQLGTAGEAPWCRLKQCPEQPSSMLGKGLASSAHQRLWLLPQGQAWRGSSSFGLQSRWGTTGSCSLATTGSRAQVWKCGGDS